jgi:hypothetical protein
MPWERWPVEGNGRGKLSEKINMGKKKSDGG